MGHKTAFIALFLLISFNAAGQSCFVSSTLPPAIHAEGLAEAVGNVILTCSGGGVGTIATANLFLSMSTGVTNRLDVNGNPTNISVTVNNGGGPFPTGVAPQLLGSTTLLLNGISYLIPAGPEIITISGIVVAPANTTLGSGVASVTAQVQATGVLIQGIVAPVILGVESTSLLASVNDNGIPCAGSPLPSTLNFASLTAAGTSSSSIRVTEAFAASFAPKTGTANTGVRILVNLSGYGTNTNVYVPDAIVGITGTVPTSAGAFGTAATFVSGGTYTPGSNQLLLIRVNGTDVNGAGGTLAMATPLTATSFSSVTQLTLTSGAGFAVYEVVDANPSVKEYAQIPVFVTVPQTPCPSTAVPILAATLAPVSKQALATATDPIPRFLATTPALDCGQIGDCAASYFPVLVVNPTSVTLNGSAAGIVQTGAFVVGNGGGGLLPFTQATTYQSGSGWLSTTSTIGANGTTISLAADPTTLTQGTYQATITINAAPYGSQNVIVTFVVGPQGPKLAVTPAAVTLTGASLGAAQQATLSVSNTGVGVLTFTDSIAYTTGTGWLTAGPMSGNTNSATITLTANPGALTAGTYQATVKVNAGTAGTISVPVTFTVGPQAPQLAVAPTAVTLTGVSMGAAQQATLSATNTGGGTLNLTVSVAYTTGLSWLSASPSSGNTNSTTITLTANPGALAAGTYQATVTLNAGTGGTISVPVTFNVGAPPPQLAVAPTAVTLTGVAMGPAQMGSFAVSNTGGGTLSFTASVSYTTGLGWLTASPTSGTNSSTINLTADPSALTAGTYNAIVTVNAGTAGTITVAVTFNVGTAPVTIQGIVNSANLQPGPITAGSYASIFGLSLAGTNVQVTFNTLAATVIYDGATQINVLVPAPAALGSATQASVVVTIGSQTSNTFTVTLTQNAPAVFNPGILNQDNSVNLTNQPATRGTYIQIFLTGLATPVTGAVTVTIGSATGLVPAYAGVSSISGLEQVNVLVPQGLTFTGNSAPLSICIAGSCSVPVNVYLN